MPEVFAPLTRVSWTDRGNVVHLGTVVSRPSNKTHEGCVEVVFDDAPWEIPVPCSALVSLTDAEEKQLVTRLNAEAMAPIDELLESIESALCSRTRWNRPVYRRARVEVSHVDIPGGDETWTVTISAKSVTPRGL